MRAGDLGLLVSLGAVALLARPASAYVRFIRPADPDGGGRFYVWWPTREVTYRVQSDCAPMNPEVVAAAEDAAAFGQLCRDAIMRSFQTWQSAGADGGQPSPCTDMVLTRLADTPVREIGYNSKDPEEGNSVLFQPRACLGLVAIDDPCWDDDSCDAMFGCFSGGPETLAQTYLTSSPSDGSLLDADIEVNAAPAPGGHDFSAETSDPLPATYDIQNTLTHEVGHFLGLDHNCGFSGAPACTDALRQATMYNGAGDPGETNKRTLEADDVAGVCHVYPTGVDTRTVNMNDALPPETVPATASSCASAQSAPGALGVALALLLVRRRRRP